MELQSQYRMHRNAQFQYVYRKGKAASGKLMTLLFAPGKRTIVGFSVSKKVGGSVVRNHVKRRMREAFRLYIPELRRGGYVVVAKPPAGESTFHELHEEMVRLMKRAACFREQA